MNLSVEKIKKAELSILMQEESFKEGWNYSQEDVDFYFHNPRNLIYAAHVDKELAGCVILHEGLSHLQEKALRSAGLFLVKEKYRGQKMVGPALWEQAITQNLGKEMLVCFHSVPRVAKFYENLGFLKTPLVDLYYSLNLAQLASSNINEVAKSAGMEQVKKINNLDCDDIDTYMKSSFSGDMGLGFCEFIHLWLRRPDAITIAFYEQGVVKGYGVATICKRLQIEGQEESYYRFSPLYADSTVIAIHILKALIHYVKQAKGQCIELYSLHTLNTEFGRAINELGFVELGKNLVISNQAKHISQDADILKTVFCSLPFEYPHEVAMSLK